MSDKSMGYVARLATGSNWIPPRWCGEAMPYIGGDLQTLSSVISPQTQQYLMPGMHDSQDMFVDLGDGDKLLLKVDLPTNQHDKTAPIMMLVHGLTGSSESTHILQCAQVATMAGWQVVRVNMRGAGDGRPHARLSYNAAAGGDLAKACQEVARLFPKRPIIMVAVSLGGSAALNMAIEQADLPIKGLAVISAPVDLLDCSHYFHKLRNYPYMRYILRGLKQMAETSPDLPAKMLDEARAAQTVWEFDEAVTAPLHGYPDATRYYQRASTAGRLDQLTLPTLILHAKNDIWIPPSPLYSALLNTALANRQTSIVIASGGGHVGFRHKDGLWHIQTMLSWAEANVI